jgi:hypothetical protein
MALAHCPVSHKYERNKKDVSETGSLLSSDSNVQKHQSDRTLRLSNSQSLGHFLEYVYFQVSLEYYMMDTDQKLSSAMCCYLPS